MSFSDQWVTMVSVSCLQHLFIKNYKLEVQKYLFGINGLSKSIYSLYKVYMYYEMHEMPKSRFKTSKCAKIDNKTNLLQAKRRLNRRPSGTCDRAVEDGRVPRVDQLVGGVDVDRQGRGHLEHVLHNVLGHLVGKHLCGETAAEELGTFGIFKFFQ